MEFLRVLCKIFFSVFLRVRVIDADKMPREGGVIVAANHESMLDMFMIGYRVPRYIKWMAKEELFKNKLVAKFITACGAYPVKRSTRDVSAARTTFEMLERGEPVGIFPQGTRGAAEGETKKGAAMLAVKTRAPILPMYITENKGFRCKATVVIGKPFLPDPKEKDYGVIADDILHRIYALKEQV